MSFAFCAAQWDRMCCELSGFVAICVRIYEYDVISIEIVLPDRSGTTQVYEFVSLVITQNEFALINLERLGSKMCQQNASNIADDFLCERICE